MADARWIAIGRDASGARAFLLEGGRVLAGVRAETEAAALAQIDAGPAVQVRIGEGAPDLTPCSVTPQAGHCVPVVTQDQPADVLGGWTRLWVAGFLARHDNWDGVLCVQDGDVTHWVHVSAGEIVSFASFLTLRLVAALGGGDRPDPGAMADSQSRPERLAGHLRQAEIAGRPDATTGHLIGAELAAARVYWLGQQVGVIAPGGNGAPHVAALSAQSVPVTVHTPDELTPGGLAALAGAWGMGVPDPH